MDYGFLKFTRNIPPDKINNTLLDIKTIFGEKWIYSFCFTHKSNNPHPWANALRKICSPIALIDDEVKSMVGDVARFFYFYNQYDSADKFKALIRMKDAGMADSLLFEILIGMNYVWAEKNFYEVEPHNISGAHCDWILRHGDIKIAVECSEKLKGIDQEKLFDKIEEKCSQLSDSISNILAIHIPTMQFNELEKIFDSSAFGKRLQGKFKNNDNLNKINFAIFSTIDLWHRCFINPHAANKIPDEFPINPAPKINW